MNGVRLHEEIRGYFTDAPCPAGACDECGCECCCVGSACMQSTTSLVAAPLRVAGALDPEGGPA
jgi:hypothetical protein